MKTILVLAARALATAMSHQAVACDYHATHAAAQTSTVVACAGDKCQAQQPATAAAPKAAGESDNTGTLSR